MNVQGITPHLQSDVEIFHSIGSGADGSSL